MATTVSQPGYYNLQALTSLGALGVGMRLYTYTQGTTTHKNAYTEATGTTVQTYTSDGVGGQYIALDARGELPYPLYLTSGAYDLCLKTSAGATVWTRRADPQGADLAASAGAAAIGFLQAGTGAVARTVQSKLREEVSATDFGGAWGSADNTAAMEAAAVYLNGLGGGNIVIPAGSGSWKMNWVCLYNNIGIEMLGGGNRQADVNCIRPYSLASAALTFGDGTNVYYGNRLVGVQISGTDGTGVTAAKCAPQCLLIKGGVVGFTDDVNCSYYTGIQTVSLKSTATQPITGARIYGAIRNDCTDSASARAIYGVSFAGNGYWTDNYVFGKVNIGSTAPDYAAEIDGTAQGITFNVGGYWDIKSGKPLYLRGSTFINGLGLQLDPGATGVVVLKVDVAGYDITRVVSGQLRSFGGQQWQSTSGTFTVPSEADWSIYRPIMRQPYIRTPINLASSTDAYRVSTYFDLPADAGPLELFGMSLGTGTAGFGLVVKEGSNAKQNLSSNMVAGTITIANTSVTANSRIFVSRDGTSGANAGALFVSTQTAGVGFVVNSTNAGDTARVVYQIFEPG